MTFFTALHHRFTELEAELNKLDAAAGDGDHGTTMLNGLTAAAAAAPGTAAKAFRTAAGGASGSLFGALLGELETWLTDRSDLAATLDTAATKITRLGQAKAGEKTMLDALIPAAQATTPAEAAQHATVGSEQTTKMAAKRGRARYVENAGQGHPDPGARSVAEILTVLAEIAEP